MTSVQGRKYVDAKSHIVAGRGHRGFRPYLSRHQGKSLVKIQSDCAIMSVSFYL